MDIHFAVLKPKIVLGVAAHPDDLDVTSSGTMALFAEEGAQVHYLILTDGSKGTKDRGLSTKKLTETREKEQQAALEAVGGKSITFLDYPDGYLEVSMDLKKAIVKVIRTICPDVVITMDPSVIYSLERGMINHPDHRACGQATLDAIYPLARDHLAFSELDKLGLKPHITKTVLLTNFDNHNYIVDISKTYSKKVAALRAHASQFKDFDGLESRFKSMAENVGRQAGYSLGESFIRIDLSF